MVVGSYIVNQLDVAILIVQQQTGPQYGIYPKHQHIGVAYNARDALVGAEHVQQLCKDMEDAQRDAQIAFHIFIVEQRPEAQDANVHVNELYILKHIWCSTICARLRTGNFYRPACRYAVIIIIFA